MPSTNKRVHTSDSDSSISGDSPNKSSLKRKFSSDISMVRVNSGRVNGLSVNGVSVESECLSLNASAMNTSNMNPIVVLHRDSVEIAMKRKSLAMSLADTSGPIDENDENEERRRRQMQRMAAQRRSLLSSSPAVGTPQRRTMAMNATQLREHYTHCIQLSTSNKINTKNAFGLYLIDCMSDLLQQTSNGFMNFKLAGSALDAGAKIYCHRVDCVHAEAQKVASSLVMALDSKSGPNASDENAPNVAHNESGDHSDLNDNADNVKPKRKKATKKNVRTLAVSPESLNLTKMESNLEIDPVFHHLSSAFDVGNVNSLLMANLKVNPSAMLMLDSNSSLNFNEMITSQTTIQSISNFYCQLEEISKISSQICPKLVSFEFLNRENGLDFMPREEDPSDINKRDSFTYDMEADLEDDMEFGDGVDGGDCFLEDDCSENTGSDEAPHLPITRKSLVSAAQMAGVGDLVKLLSDKPNDYSYFNPKLLTTWAGPNHWKRCPFVDRKRQTAKNRRQRKQYIERTFGEEILGEDCDKTGGSNLKLKVQTLEKWQKNDIELQLPADYGFDAKDLTGSFIKPEFTFQCAKSGDETLAANNNALNDSFEPASPGFDRFDYDDDDVDPNTGAFNEGLGLAQSAPVSMLASAGEAFPFVGDNLVEQPYDVNSINLPYAKFAKKMDVKKLKRAMWDVLTNSVDQITPEIPAVQTPLKRMNAKLNFGDLYQSLPKKVTPLMASNLSAPIAFVTLLHLCNERNLSLIGRDDLEDFGIEQQLVQNTLI